jgi:integrase
MQAIETKPKKRRRGRGEGCIYQRADGRWMAMVSLGKGANNKRRRRAVYGKTKGDVQTELLKLQSAGAAGTLLAIDKETVSGFLARWLADVAKPGLRATTFANYKAVCDKHIGPRIGGERLQKLTPAHVQGLYGEMDRDGVGPSARRLAHAVLRRALKHAVRQGLVVRNVCESVEAPQVPKSKIQPLDQSQVARLFAAAVGDRLEALYHLAVGSGMREGEMFGLQWSDVDLVAGTVSVRQSLSELAGKLTLGEPKSKSSRRMVKLSARVVAALEKHRKRQMAAGFGGVEFVFCNQSGGPLRRSHLHAADYKPLLKRAGLPEIRFHDLRHTYATMMLLAGVNPKVVQEQLGHANIGITLDTYSHVMPSMSTDATDRLDALLGKAMADLENGSQLAVKRA